MTLVELKAEVEAGTIDTVLLTIADMQGRLQGKRMTAGHFLDVVVEREASWAIAAGLELQPGSPVVRIRRLRLGSGVPLALEDSWIPGEKFPGIADRDLSGSIYDLMREEYGLEPVRAVERLEPVIARAHEAKALNMEVGAPLMLVERTAYAADGTPVEFARDRHRGDKARWIVKVTSDALVDVRPD